MGQGKFVQWLEPEKIAQLVDWARNGLTDRQIMKNIGISQGTFYHWLKCYPDIASAINRGRQTANDIIENALFKRAIDHDVEIIKHYKLRHVEYNQRSGKKIREWDELVEKIETTHFLGDVNAQIFWLSNRRPDKWSRNPKQLEQSDSENKYGVVILPAVLPEPEPPDIIERDNYDK